jgi:hypothetical protein
MDGDVESNLDCSRFAAAWPPNRRGCCNPAISMRPGGPTSQKRGAVRAFQYNQFNTSVTGVGLGACPALAG